MAGLRESSGAEGFDVRQDVLGEPIEVQRKRHTVNGFTAPVQTRILLSPVLQEKLQQRLPTVPTATMNMTG